MRRKIEITLVGGVEGKECGKCKTWKPLTEFHKSESNKGGRAYMCVICTTEYRKTYNKQTVDKRRRWYLENRDHLRKLRKERYWRDRDKILEERRNMSEEEKQAINARRRELYPLHKEKCIANARRRKTIMNGLVDDFTEEDRIETLKYFNGCIFTGSQEFQWDHVIPIKTGHGGTTYGNMLPLCELYNKSKRERNIFEWFEANRQRFDLSIEKFNKAIEWLAEVNGISVEDYRDYVYWCHENPHDINDLLEVKNEEETE